MRRLSLLVLSSVICILISFVLSQLYSTENFKEKTTESLNTNTNSFLTRINSVLDNLQSTKDVEKKIRQQEETNMFNDDDVDEDEDMVFNSI